MRIARAIFVTICLIGLSGCSNWVKLAYDNADFAAAVMVDGYLDLSSGQEDDLDAYIDAIHLWHRRHEIPRYVTLLSEIRSRIAAGAGREDIDWASHEVRLSLHRAVSQSIEMSAPFLASLRSANLDHFEDELEKSSREFAQENGLVAVGSQRSPDYDARHEKLMELGDDWLGHVTDRQSAMLRAYAVQSMPELIVFAEGRRDRNQALMKILRAGLSAEQLGARVRGLLETFEGRRGETYVASVRRWRRIFGELLLQMADSLEPSQKAHLLSRIDHYLEQLRAIESDRGKLSPTAPGVIAVGGPVSGER
jgi:hypothetical protein